MNNAYLIFGAKDNANYLSKLSPEKLNLIPFGVIKLDSNGKILEFNQAEASLIRKNAKDLIGLNFFDDVAPCLKNFEFYGKFEKGVKEKKINIVFEYNIKQVEYNFTVKVHIAKPENEDIYWIMIKRL